MALVAGQHAETMSVQAVGHAEAINRLSQDARRMIEDLVSTITKLDEESVGLAESTRSAGRSINNMHGMFSRVLQGSSNLTALEAVAQAGLASENYEKIAGLDGAQGKQLADIATTALHLREMLEGNAVVSEALADTAPSMWSAVSMAEARGREYRDGV
jgi:hypothetical protein